MASLQTSEWYSALAGGARYRLRADSLLCRCCHRRALRSPTRRSPDLQLHSAAANGNIGEAWPASEPVCSSTADLAGVPSHAPRRPGQICLDARAARQ